MPWAATARAGEAKKTRPGILARPGAWVVAGFLLTRTIYFALGVRFHSEHAAAYYQFLDLDLLRHDLWTSLYYLHGQPPGLNLLTGIGLKLAPSRPDLFFHAVFLVAGLCLVLSLYYLLAVAGVPSRLAAGAALIYSASPATILFENFLFYTYPVMVLLAVAAARLHRFLRDGRWLDGTLFFGACGVAVLTRSVFHALWLIGLVLVLLVWSGLPRRRVLAAAFLPVLLATGWYVKNLFVFGSFTSSTWLGMNLIRVARLPEQECQAFARSGALSPLACISPFGPLSGYAPYIDTSSNTGVPVLDRPLKAGTATNFNHAAYIPISRQYLRDALKIIRLRPGAYAFREGIAVWAYFLPATEWFQPGSPGQNPNWERVRVPARVANAAGGQPSALLGEDLTERPPRMLARLRYPAWLVLVTFPVVIFWACREAGRTFRRDRATALTIAFSVLVILYVALTSNLLEVGENNRYRYSTSPLFFALAVACVYRFVQRIVGRRVLQNHRPSAF